MSAAFAPKLNCKQSPKDARDFIAKPAVSKGALATSVDLSSNCTSVKDQGSLGSCTAFACVGMMEYFLKKNGIVVKDDLLSELFLYYNTRVLVEGGAASDDSGGYLRDVLMAMNKYGVCVESVCPYVTAKYAQKPATSAYKDGLNYQVVKYAAIPTSNTKLALTDLKTLLANGQVFVGGVVCYSNFLSGNGKGVIPPPSGTVIGGHAVLFVGYDDTKQWFKFKNSWSTRWGDKGYGYLPYTYLTTNNLFDLWTIFGQEYANKMVDNNGSVIPPTVRQQQVCDRMGAILTRLSGQDAASSLPLACVPSAVTVLKTEITTDPNNALLTASDIAELLALVDRVAQSVKFTQTKLAITGVL
jgi:hypothetical protein